MTRGRANVRLTPPVRIGMLLLAVTVVAAAVTTARWERTEEIVPGFRPPAYSRLVDREHDTGRDTCTYDLATEGPPDEVRAAYGEGLRAAGWNETGRSGDRVIYERADAAMRVAVRIPTATEPGWSRVRIVVAPCEAG